MTMCKTAGVVFLALCIASCRASDRDEVYFPLPDKRLEVIHSEAQSFSVDTVLTGLVRPWGFAFLPDGVVLITERRGNLLFIRDGVIQGSVDGNVPNGLRDIELHPDFEKNRLIYLSYYTDPDSSGGGYTVLMRGRLNGQQLVDEEILYRAGPFEEDGEWYGSRIAFDREGYLYFTVGIRGKRLNAQDKSHYAGKTMRLHDDGRIPADNPYIDSIGVLPEIYTYGHRMHEGLVVHPETGEVWAHEHGEFGGDEVNLIKAGANYGWPKATYSLEYDGTLITADTLLDGIEPPVHHWTPSIAPSGMDFLYGGKYPGWEGDLFSGALSHRMLNRSVVENGRIVRDEPLLSGIGRVRDVEVGPDGFLYLITEDTGLMVRLLPVR